jgi:hypothetical protein
MGMTYQEAIKQVKYFGVDKAENRRIWSKYPDKGVDTTKHIYKSTAIVLK